LPTCEALRPLAQSVSRRLTLDGFHSVIGCPKLCGFEICTTTPGWAGCLIHFDPTPLIPSASWAIPARCRGRLTTIQ
jgi:hypothetical protein